MNAFAAMISLSEQTALKTTDRLNRMVNAGWSRAETPSDVQVMLRGRAEFATHSDISVFGLATITHWGSVTPPAGSSDVAHIAFLVKNHGTAFIADLMGAFSIAVIDLGKGSVQLFRDHFGMVPVYYTIHQGCLTCGSNLRAVLHLSSVELTPHQARVADFITEATIDPKLTSFQRVLRLPAAHVIQAPDFKPTPYWQLEKPYKRTDIEEAPKLLQHQLVEAVRRSLSKSKSMGAMLSGGLDSSALTALAAADVQKQSAAPLKTLSFVYPNHPANDESRFIKSVASASYTEPTLIPVLEPPNLSGLDDLIEEQMDLFQAPGLLKSRAIYSIAHQQGITDVLDGHGGDEVISHGYGRLIELAAAHRWVKLFIEMKGAAKVHRLPFVGQYFHYIAKYGGPSLPKIFRRVLLKLAKFVARKKSDLIERPKTETLLSAALGKQVDAFTRYAPAPSNKDFRDFETTAHLEVLQSHLIAHSFEVLHHAAAAHGVEPHYPFFDRNLVGLCLSMPSHAKLQKGQTRWVLREAMKGILPSAITQRTDKTNFANEVEHSVIAYLKNQDFRFYDNLSTYVDCDRIHEIQQKVLSAKAPNPFEVRVLWRICVLWQWQNAFLHWQTLQRKGALI